MQAGNESGEADMVTFSLKCVLVLCIVFVWSEPARSAAETEYVDLLDVERVAVFFPKGAYKNVQQYWPLVQAELKHYGLGGSKEVVIYALATIRAETSVFSPAPEDASKYSWTIDRASYAGIQDPGTKRPFGAYDSTIRVGKDGKPVINKHLGNCLYTGKDEALMRSRHGMPPRPECQDGERYRGRGFIQLTGRYNYEKMQQKLNGTVEVDIATHPEALGAADVAAKVLAAFLAKHRVKIARHMKSKQYRAARKVVNTAALGMDVFLDVIHKAEKKPTLKQPPQ